MEHEAKWNRSTVNTMGWMKFLLLTLVATYGPPEASSSGVQVIGTFTFSQPLRAAAESSHSEHTGDFVQSEPSINILERHAELLEQTKRTHEADLEAVGLSCNALEAVRAKIASDIADGICNEYSPMTTIAGLAAGINQKKEYMRSLEQSLSQIKRDLGVLSKYIGQIRELRDKVKSMSCYVDHASQQTDAIQRMIIRLTQEICSKTEMSYHMGLQKCGYQETQNLNDRLIILKGLKKLLDEEYAAAKAQLLRIDNLYSRALGEFTDSSNDRSMSTINALAAELWGKCECAIHLEQAIAKVSIDIDLLKRTIRTAREFEARRKSIEAYQAKAQQRLNVLMKEVKQSTQDGMRKLRDKPVDRPG